MKTKTTNQAATWWEKTVEYNFILSLHRCGLMDFAAPLSGKHERSAGDGIFGKDNKLVLIEFKRDRREIATERTLFHNYDAAKELLGEHFHHWIVYGLINDLHAFSTIGQKYFDAQFEINIHDIPGTGVCHEDFMEYLTVLSQLKYPDGRSDGGHVSPESMSLVLGVTAEGKITGTCSLHEYAPMLSPAPAPAPAHIPTSTPSSFPRMR